MVEREALIEAATQAAYADWPMRAGSIALADLAGVALGDPIPWARSVEIGCDHAGLRRIAAASVDAVLTAQPLGEPEGWRDGSTAPRDGTRFLGALRATTNGAPTEWEQYIVWCDDTTGQVHGMCEFGWEIEDVEFWRPLPSPPTNDEGRSRG